jgi:hypothetical protein
MPIRIAKRTRSGMGRNTGSLACRGIHGAADPEPQPLKDGTAGTAARESQRSEQIHLEDPVRFIVIGLLQRTYRSGARVVDEDIKPPGGPDYRDHRGVRGSRICQIKGDRCYPFTPSGNGARCG